MGETFHTGPHQPTDNVVAGARTVGEVFRRRAQATPDAPASYEKRDGAWREITWSGLYRQAAAAARGLVDLGLEAGDRIAILGPTRVDWTVWDLGGHLAGLVTVGIYSQQSPDQVRYILEHSDSRAVFVAGADELRTVLEAAAGNSVLEAIVPWEDDLAGRFTDADERGPASRVVAPARFRGATLSEEEIDAGWPGSTPATPRSWSTPRAPPAPPRGR